MAEPPEATHANADAPEMNAKVKVSSSTARRELGCFVTRVLKLRLVGSATSTLNSG